MTTEEEIREKLKVFYASEEDIKKWLTSPHELLGGKTAQELIDDGKGHKVLDVIKMMEDCVYL